MQHGCNPESDARKNKIVLDLQQRFGALERKHPNRHDWYSLKADKIEIFITDSQAHYAERPWFDMERRDIKLLAEHPAGFVVFILGDADTYLVVPAKRLQDELKNYVAGRRKAPRGFYHFNLLLPGKAFAQLPNFDLHPYLKNLQLIQSAIDQ